MKQIYCTFLATVIVFTSCKNDDTQKSQATGGVVVPFTQQTTTALPNQSAQTPVVEKHNLFRENNVSTASSVVTAVNPPHGQPNHRCDIAVGAPLNSAPNKSVASVGQANVKQPQSTQIITSKTSTSKVVTAKGMNPPHGEEGHRCDIAVGAPLNSKPVANATTSTQVTPNANVQHPIPALLATDGVETKASEDVKLPTE